MNKNKFPLPCSILAISVFPVCPEYDTERYQMVWLPSWSFGECSVFLLYFLVHSDRVMVVPVRVPSIGKIELFNHLRMIIIISYLKLYSCAKIIGTR